MPPGTAATPPPPLFFNSPWVSILKTFKWAPLYRNAVKTVPFISLSLSLLSLKSGCVPVNAIAERGIDVRRSRRGTPFVSSAPVRVPTARGELIGPLSNAEAVTPILAVQPRARPRLIPCSTAYAGGLARWGVRQVAQETTGRVLARSSSLYASLPKPCLLVRS